jgi:hypothetical protein
MGRPDPLPFSTVREWMKVTAIETAVRRERELLRGELRRRATIDVRLTACSFDDGHVFPSLVDCAELE